RNAPTRTVTAGGVDYAYRDLGPKAGVPVIFLVHLAGTLDNWDPRVVDGIAAKHRVIAFDNRGVGASTGETPDSIQAMAKDAVTFIRALGFDQVDLHGFSMGGMIAQLIPGSSRSWFASWSTAHSPRVLPIRACRRGSCTARATTSESPTTSETCSRR